MIDFGETRRPRSTGRASASSRASKWTLSRGRPQMFAPSSPRGHKLKENKDSYMDFGPARIIWKTADGYITGSDPRRDGCAVGF